MLPSARFGKRPIRRRMSIGRSLFALNCLISSRRRAKAIRDGWVARPVKTARSDLGGFEIDLRQIRTR